MIGLLFLLLLMLLFGPFAIGVVLWFGIRVM